MKKKLIFVVTLGIVAAAAFGQTATMTSPAAGASWAMGTNQTISWNSQGSATIKLILVRQNGAKLGVIKSGLQLSAGTYSWKVGTLEAGAPPLAAGNYRIRISTMDSAIIHAGPVFSILVPATKSQPMMVMHPVRAIAVIPTAPIELMTIKQVAVIPAPPPATAAFAIKKVTYEFESMGKLRFVDVLVSVSSPVDFSISPSYGDPQYGAQWISYEIFNPAPQKTAGVWISDVFSGTFSVKGGGTSKVFSYFPTAPVPAGNREYILSFKPLYNGRAEGAGTVQQMPSGQCRQEFYPKLKLNFIAHTAKGPVMSSAAVYLIYDTNIWPLNWISFPGETNLCSGGFQSW